MCHKIFVVFLVALVGTQFSDVAAVSITKCKSSDAQCIRKSAVAALPAFADGIPELNVAPIDPLHLDFLDASTPDLKLVLSNIVFKGLRKCDIKKMERDVANSKLIVSSLCDIDVTTKYEINGRIVTSPIEGKGDAEFQLNKILFDTEAHLGETTDKQGVKHWDLKSFNNTFDLQDTAKIRFENLFNGNKELAAAVNTLLETNANEVIKAVGTPIVKAIVANVAKQVNQFFHTQRIEDLTLD